MGKTPVIDAKWHADRVARHQEWIEFSKEQIKWFKERLANTEAHLKTEELWLAQALADQKEF
jgi:hypothetical protein